MWLFIYIKLAIWRLIYHLTVGKNSMIKSQILKSESVSVSNVTIHSIKLAIWRLIYHLIVGENPIMQNMFFMIYLSWPCKDSFGEITKQKDKVVLNKLKLTRFSVTCANSSRATSDLKVWSFLYWAWVPSRPWLFVTENGWLPAYWEMFNKNLSFLLWFITCIPVLHMTAWAPLLKKVGEKSCDMAELSGVQGRVGGVMLHEEVGESVELGGCLRHPLKRLDVREDGGSQVIVDLPHAGQLCRMFRYTWLQHISLVLRSGPKASSAPFEISQAPSAMLNLGTPATRLTKLKLVAQDCVSSCEDKVMWVRKKRPVSVDTPWVRTGYPIQFIL